MSEPSGQPRGYRRLGAAIGLGLVCLATPAAALGGSSASAQTWAATHPADGYDITGTTDPWGFEVGTCISYVAWWENAHGHPIYLQDWWGSANRLLSDPPAGWTVAAQPRIGDVAVWLPDQVVLGTRMGVAGPQGHVGIVTYVFRDGSVEVAQYNADGLHQWSPGRFFSSGHYLRLPSPAPPPSRPVRKARHRRRGH